MKLDVWSYSNPGGRPYNEDSALWKEQENHAFFALADGLGGHRGGERASAYVTSALLDAWQSTTACVQSREEWLRATIGSINNGLLAQQQIEKNQMKSTLVSLTLDDGRATWAHVGDSRLYYLHNGGLQRLTADHSVTYKKYQSGTIKLDEMNFDEDRSALLCTMGHTERCKPDIASLPTSVVPGDGFLLCSDGFWEYLYDTELLVDQLKADSAQEWGELLLLRVMERLRPDTDNLTVLTILVK